MAQGVLPFKYEEENKDSGTTALGGLPVYLDLATTMRLSEIIEKHLHIKHQGWTDRQILLSLILLNFAGGDFVNDLVKLEGDSGFCRVLRRIEQSGLKRAQRRELERRWRKEQKRCIASPSAVFRYLAAFNDREWWIVMLAFNLNNDETIGIGRVMDVQRMKAIRFSLIHVPGRIVERSHEMIIRQVKDSPASELLIKARRRIMALCPVPSG